MYYVVCNHETLHTIQYGYTNFDNWFYHLCQNEYDISEYSNEFDKMHGVKKRCKQYVEKLMETFVNSITTSKEYDTLFLKNNN